MNTILVLEDDPSNMQAFSALLWSKGYHVLEATTGKKALLAGNHHDPAIDLLVSDVAVPEPSGTVVALELVKSYPAMGILFVSGTPIYAWDRNDLQNFRKLPSDLVDFLEKPFRASAFLDKVDEMLRRRGRRSAYWPRTEARPRMVKISKCAEGSRSSMMDVEGEHNHMRAAFGLRHRIGQPGTPAAE
jgi:response regulator RpfG family c-di-GMP phosphodiesterase